MAAAASAPSAAMPTLKTYDAASMSTQDLLAFTARPRVDFDSILATVRFCLFFSCFFIFKPWFACGISFVQDSKFDRGLRAT